MRLLFLFVLLMYLLQSVRALLGEYLCVEYVYYGVCIHENSKIFSFNHLKTKSRPLYLKTHSVPRCKHFSSRLQKPISYGVSGTSCCLFSDKYKKHKYSVGIAYSCLTLRRRDLNARFSGCLPEFFWGVF
jgi:hypothetical protein